MTESGGHLKSGYAEVSGRVLQRPQLSNRLIPLTQNEGFDISTPRTLV